VLATMVIGIVVAFVVILGSVLLRDARRSRT